MPGSSSTVDTKNAGKAKPIVIPIGYATEPIVTAMTLSFSPNHIAESFAIVIAKIGPPSAAIVYPINTKEND